MTVNSAIELVNTLRGRISELTSLRDRCSVVDTYYDGDNKQTKEPLYDPVDVDTKIVLIKNSIRKLNTKIKESNSITKIDFDVDEDSLLSPIKSNK